MTGRYSSVDATTANLIVPRKVHANGTHLSHDLTHHHPSDTVEDASENSANDGDSATLHYHIELPSHTVHVQLK